MRNVPKRLHPPVSETVWPACMILVSSLEAIHNALLDRTIEIIYGLNVSSTGNGSTGPTVPPSDRPDPEHDSIIKGGGNLRCDQGKTRHQSQIHLELDERRAGKKHRGLCCGLPRASVISRIYSKRFVNILCQ